MTHTIKCRAMVSNHCYNGKEIKGSVYENEEDYESDGTWDGESIICDACYIAIGQPAVPVAQGPQLRLKHVNEVLAQYQRRHGKRGGS